MAEPTVRVLLVAEDALARAGLASVLAERTDILVVGQCGPQGELDLMLAATQPDVLLWDLGWSPEAQLETLMDRSPDLPPVVVLLAGAENFAEARRVGARALLSREADAGTLALAAHAARLGLRVFDPALEDLQPGTLPREGKAPAVDLTGRELEVLRLVAEGLPNKAIAARLGVSDHTIKFHLNALLRKLGAQSRTDAVVRATRLGLLYL